MITTSVFVSGVIGVLLGIIVLTAIIRWYYLYPRASNNWLDKRSYANERCKYVHELLKQSAGKSWELQFLDQTGESEYMVTRESKTRISIVPIVAVLNVKKKLICILNVDICALVEIKDVNLNNGESITYTTDSYSEFLEMFEHKIPAYERLLNFIVNRIILRN